MSRKIAVLVQDRQGEALRMALGLTLMDDKVEVFLLGRQFQLSDKDRDNKELMEEMDVLFYSDHAENQGTELISTRDLATKLAEYDHILPY